MPNKFESKFGLDQNIIKVIGEYYAPNEKNQIPPDDLLEAVALLIPPPGQKKTPKGKWTAARTQLIGVFGSAQRVGQLFADVRSIQTAGQFSFDGTDPLKFERGPNWPYQT